MFCNLAKLKRSLLWFDAIQLRVTHGKPWLSLSVLKHFSLSPYIQEFGLLFPAMFSAILQKSG
jgi:hypothetical protein